MNAICRKPSKLPWGKELRELTKYDWSIAVGLHGKHKNCPLDLRVANVLMQKADSETCLMWATQQTIAQLVGVADERQVRTALRRLENSGAINRKRIADLQPDTWDVLVDKMSANRNKRGAVYTLRLFWALEVFEAAKSKVASEPAHLQKARDAHRTTIVRNDRTTIVRSGQDYDSPPYTTVGNYTDTDGAYEREEPIKVSTAPSNTYSCLRDGIDPDQPFPAPSSDEEAHHLIEALRAERPVTPGVVQYWRQKLEAGELTINIVEAIFRRAA